MIERSKFDLVLGSLERSVAENKCFILLRPPFPVAIEVRDRETFDALAEQGVTRAERDEAVRDITDLVLAALQEQADEYIAHRTADDETDQAGEWSSRANSVAAALVDERLQSRYLLKRLSKAPAFSDVDWDVKLKVGDASEPDLKRFPYATIKLKFQRDFSDDPWSWIGGGSTVESVQVNFTRDELDYLIHSLEGSRDALLAAEEEFAS